MLTTPKSFQWRWSILRNRYPEAATSFDMIRNRRCRNLHLEWDDAIVILPNLVQRVCRPRKDMPTSTPYLGNLPYVVESLSNHHLAQRSIVDKWHYRVLCHIEGRCMTPAFPPCCLTQDGKVWYYTRDKSASPFYVLIPTYWFLRRKEFFEEVWWSKI